MSDRRKCHCCGGSGFEPEPLDGVALLLAISRDIGPLSFTTAELRRHASEIDGRLRTVLAGYNPKIIGRTLKRMEGRLIDNMRLERQAKDTGSNTALWKLRVF